MDTLVSTAFIVSGTRMEKDGLSPALINSDQSEFKGHNMAPTKKSATAIDNNI